MSDDRTSDDARNDAPLPGAMPGNLPEGARPPDDFDPVALAKQILRTGRSAALGTIDRNTGHPMASLASYATDHDGSPIILVSALSSHTANLDADPRASLLVAETGKGDPLAHPRLTVLGRFETLTGGQRSAARARFLARHPKAALYADFGDFTFRRLTVEAGHLNGGFAKAADLTAGAILTDISDAAHLVTMETGAVEHMNEDHADAIEIYATGLLGARAGKWRMTGLDPEGCDLALGDETLRLAFPARVTDGNRLRAILVEMAKSARAATRSD